VKKKSEQERPENRSDERPQDRQERRGEQGGDGEAEDPRIETVL